MSLSQSPFGEKKEPKEYTIYELKIRMVNVGDVLAQYVVAFIDMPCTFVFDRRAGIREHQGESVPRIDLGQYCRYKRNNTTRDVIKYGAVNTSEYGPVRYVPILPGTAFYVKDFQLTRGFETVDWGTHVIRWTTRADNAPPYSEGVAIKDIEIVDRRGMGLWDQIKDDVWSDF
jgi:hypothetical protein